jgi:hypothetical protein
MVLTLPNEEIERLWFGGLSFEPGKAFPPEAITRWFSQTAEFDKKCRYPLSHSLLIETL